LTSSRKTESKNKC